ncbi:gamma-glutamyltransferase [Pseudochelatococcus sp. B33]
MTALERIRENVVVAGRKVVTAGHPAAASAGVHAFSNGGNAFDAALAACFMEHIALPMKCGLAGDLVALFRTDGGPFQSLVSIGAGAAALARGARMEHLGAASVGIPGAPHGYATLHAMARCSLADLTEPAIRAASAGIPWTRVTRSYVVEARDLLARHSPNNPYAPRGRIPEIGEIRRLPVLGELLRTFNKRQEALFEGELGEEVVRVIAAGGGFIAKEDFRQRPARIQPAIESRIGEHTFSVTGEPTHGSQLIRIIRRVMEGEDIVAAVRAERDAAKRAGRARADGGTSVVASADDEGNAVVVLHSNSFPQFASGVVLDSGLILNNRPGRGFDLEAPSDAANAPAAGRVPKTTLHAWSLESPDRHIIGATPGGVNQLPWNAQMIGNLLSGCDLNDVMIAPRWSLDAKNILAAEPGALLAPMEHVAIDELSLRSAQQLISITPSLHRAAADPRTGASAQALF